MINILEINITDEVKHFVIVGTVSPKNKPLALLKRELEALKEEIETSEFCRECEENDMKYSIFLTAEDAVVPDEVLEQIRNLIESKENGKE